MSESVNSANIILSISTVAQVLTKVRLPPSLIPSPRHLINTGDSPTVMSVMPNSINRGLEEFYDVNHSCVPASERNIETQV